MKSKVIPIGTLNVNARVRSEAKFGRKKFFFDGTILDLTVQAIRLGAVDGSLVHAKFGFDFRPMRIVVTPHDDRAGGFWAR